MSALFLKRLCPFAESINRELLELAESVDFCKSYQTNLMCKMSGWRMQKNLHVQALTFWAENLVCQNYKVTSARCFEVWVARYDFDDYAKEHNHRGCQFSFVYFANTPKGSAPLCFTDSQIAAEAGQLVLFDSAENHSVPKNNCENRLVVAGNIWAN
jgi:hypothetical protein